MELTKNFYPSNHTGDGKKYVEIVLTENEAFCLEICLFVLLVKAKECMTSQEQKLLTAIHEKLTLP
jgi:hypothetical protein